MIQHYDCMQTQRNASLHTNELLNKAVASPFNGIMAWLKSEMLFCRSTDWSMNDLMDFGIELFPEG